MICTVCDVWYDPQRGCDHRVILMNMRDGFIKAEKEFPATSKIAFALLAIVELHKPGNGEESKCEACYLGFDCPTIKAIGKALS